MKVLFVGGTGIISTACAERALGLGMEVWLLNRGRSPRHTPPPEGARLLTADASDSRGLEAALGTHRFDAVVDFIAYVPKDVERGIEVFGPRTRQYVFVSSASAYQKPPAHWLITESTPLANPFWQYSRDKIACEERLLVEHRTNGLSGDHRPAVSHLRPHPDSGGHRKLGAALHRRRPHAARRTDPGSR